MMAAANSFSIGIDISKASMDVALCPEGFESKRWMDLPVTHIPHAPESPQALDALLAWLRSSVPQGASATCMVVESTGQFSRRFSKAASGCADLPAVSIINPQRSNAFGKSLGARDKSDGRDAKILALFGQERQPPATPQLPEQQEKARARSRLRERYVRDLTAWKNRLGEALDEEERASIERSIGFIEAEIERLDNIIKTAIERDETLWRQQKNLQKIRGIKRVVSHTLTAELGDLATYGRGQLVAAAGLYPKCHESGTSIRKPPRLAKGGGGRIRRVLYMAAFSLFRAKGPWPAFITRLQSRGFCKMQIIGIMMRKLLLIARSVAISGVYDESKIG